MEDSAPELASVGVSPDGTLAEVTAWVEFFDSDGDPYYYNTVTMDTTRERPAAASVVMLTEEEYMRTQDTGRKSVESVVTVTDDWESFTADDGSK
jgi:hypothetical protein